MAKCTTQQDHAHRLKSPPIKLANIDELVRSINTLTADDFQQKYMSNALLTVPQRPDNGRDADIVTIHFLSAYDLSDHDLQICLNLIEATSRHDYENSFLGWSPTRKMKEMRELDMRYLLVHDRHKSIVGFLSFMITFDSIPTVPVLYIYEIHLAKTIRGLGIGTHLMSIVETIASSTGLSKTMLTCFRSNEKARQFYDFLAYVVDASSPRDRRTRNRLVESDYQILSKEIDQAS